MVWVSERNIEKKELSGYKGGEEGKTEERKSNRKQTQGEKKVKATSGRVLVEEKEAMHAEGSRKAAA